MILFGKEKRAEFEEMRDAFCVAVCRRYDEAKVYHDGKWVMFETANTAELEGCLKLPAIKRKPNRQ